MALTNHPDRTRILRITHAENLPVFLQRGGLHAPSCCPSDGLSYRAIHDEAIGKRRKAVRIPCGPRGVVDDYVSFYFGDRSPMLFRIQKERPKEQREIVYLVSSITRLQELSLSFVFSDGHSLAKLTSWYDDTAELERLDWGMINERMWRNTLEDPDRDRRKQAELLVHGFFPLSALTGIAVSDEDMRKQVQEVLRRESSLTLPIKAVGAWYY